MQPRVIKGLRGAGHMGDDRVTARNLTVVRVDAGRNTLVYYFIGIGTLVSYLPLYWYRKRVEDKRHQETPPVAIPTAGS